MTPGRLLEVVLVGCLLHCLGGSSVHYSATGEVDAESYKYFRVFMEGNIRLELHSTSGDADLYVSDETESPTVAHYGLSSASCGVEVVDVPSTFHRPLGVGVYAYPSYLNCSFVLSVFRLPDTDERDLWENNFEALYASFDSGIPYEEERTTASDKGYVPQQTVTSDDEPLWWKVLLTLLKIIVDAAL